MVDLHTYMFSYDIPEYLDEEKKQKNTLTGLNILAALSQYGGLDLTPENGFILYDYKNQILKQNILVSRPVKSTWFFHSYKDLNQIALALSHYDGMLYYVLTEVKEQYPVFSKMLYEESLQTEIDEWIKHLKDTNEKIASKETALIGIGAKNEKLEKAKDLSHRIEHLPQTASTMKNFRRK